MKHYSARGGPWAAMLVAVLLAGCGNMPPILQRDADKTPAPAPAPVPAPPAATSPTAPAAPAPAPALAPSSPSAAQRDLTEGIELYDRGEFNAAISKLGSSAEISAASPEIQVTAHKYLAFSFCVTRRQAQCRTQFENAFKLDPAFDLTPAERGHPLWGPVFERVKKSRPAPAK